MRPWAKLERDEDDRIVAALPLTDHCLDVAAAFLALLPAWRPALEAAAGRRLTELDVIRLAVLVALHDIGKVNWGFQARSTPGQPPIGHTAQVAGLLLQTELGPVGIQRELMTAATR
ncbi:HD domain-containing protein [Sphingomonas sp. Leaf4]|uniref:HD domain-containing protein n=1 Tax=Sphingomonas sp. Leaf4 TaxID=2876553 RepID=UPI001E39FD92|nr:HD domain-containing protein [Sphingomonas sp. Leaf4]